MTTDTGYLSETMAIIIHTCNGTTPYCLQSFSLFQVKNNKSTIAAAPQSQFSLAWKRRLCLDIYKIQEIQLRGGANPHGIKWNQLMESSSMPDLCLIEPDLSLTEYNCQSESWSDWHLNLFTEASTKTHPDEPKRVEERGREKFPIKDAQDQLWI